MRHRHPTSKYKKWLMLLVSLFAVINGVISVNPVKAASDTKNYVSVQVLAGWLKEGDLLNVTLKNESTGKTLTQKIAVSSSNPTSYFSPTVTFDGVKSGKYTACYYDYCSTKSLNWVPKSGSDYFTAIDHKIDIFISTEQLNELRQKWNQPLNNTVDVFVNLSIPKTEADTTYGPTNVVLVYADGSDTGKGTKATGSKVVQAGSAAQSKLPLGMAEFYDANLKAGDYKACTQDLAYCSSNFTVTTKANKYSATINIPLSDSAKFITSGGVGATKCGIEGVGWIICPVVNFLAKIADGSYAFLESNFLKVSPDMLSTSTSDSAYTAWSTMRSIANVAFVIAFLIIIFSQITGAGVTNYGIKRLLPKIIIAAILVNLSFIICQILVDLSNIIGQSFSEIFQGLPAGKATPGGFGSGSDWTSVAGGAIAIAGGGALVWANIAALIPLLVSAVIALVMILFILIARQAIVVLLIVVSPLAFVAYLLPNTENWFKKWRETLQAMLILYPVVALIYGVSGYAAKILQGAMSDSTMGQIVAAGVMVLPLFAIPTVLKKALDGVGNLGATLNGWSSKLGGAAGNKLMNDTVIGQAAKYKDQRSALRRAQIQSGTYQGRGGRWNPRNLHSAISDRFNKAGISGGFGDRRTAQGAALEASESTELLNNAGARLDGMQVTDPTTGVASTLSQAQMMQIATGQDVTHDGTAGGRAITGMGKGSFDTHARQAAMQKAASIATVSDAEKLVNASGSGTMSADERKTLSNALAASGALKKAPWLGGATLGAVAAGTAGADQAALDAIRDGKVTAEVLANGDKNSVDTLLRVARTAGSGSAEVAALQAAIAGITADPNLKSKIAPGGEHDQKLGQIASL